jgi:hypothetical protein
MIIFTRFAELIGPYYQAKIESGIKYPDKAGMFKSGYQIHTGSPIMVTLIRDGRTAPPPTPGPRPKKQINK